MRNTRSDGAGACKIASGAEDGFETGKTGISATGFGASLVCDATGARFTTIFTCFGSLGILRGGRLLSDLVPEVPGEISLGANGNSDSLKRFADVMDES